MSNSSSSNGTNFEPLFSPKAIGIIGASYDPTGAGYFARVMKGKFRGPIYLFNPKLSGKELFGLKVYSSILEIPADKPIDYVILGIKAALCPKVLEECGQKKVPFVTIFSSGFSEVGNQNLEKEVMAIAKKYNIRLIGPNCMGVYSPEAGLYIGNDQSKKAGNFSGVLQSGGLTVDVAQLAVSYGVEVSKLISVGNAIDLSHADFLDYFINDDRTKIVGLYLENLRSKEVGRKFLISAKNCNLNRKPVILWRAGFGQATKKAIVSHTGGLAGNDAIWKAVAKQTGCCLVDNSTELAALASAFKLVKLPSSRNVAIIGIGGGSTIEACDALERHNLKIPRLTEGTIKKMTRFLPSVNVNVNNPLDLGASGSFPNIYFRTILALENDPNIAAILFVKDPERFASMEKDVIESMKATFKPSTRFDLNKEFIRYISKAKKVCKKPIICVMLKISEGFEQYKSRYKFKLKLLIRSVPVFESVDLAGIVLDHLNTYREFLQNQGKYPKVVS